ncbi:MAG: DNA topoisomerase III [Magnetococcales bacterium]|nr:DNA topoisomerase III [Magnetococcales bacterium]
MILYVCEKPSQARDIAGVLGVLGRREGYLEGNGKQVTWCIGHLLEMKMPDHYRPEWKYWHLETLPIIPDHWQLDVREGVSKQFAIIQKLLKGATEVVIATDADREGETIGREVLDQCGYRGPVARLWLSALDDASIRKALNALLPGEKTAPLYQAGLGRARADWLVGMNLSRAYTLLGRQAGYGGVLTVGRVQTPTLKLVVDRDRQIENFKPVHYFDLTIQARVSQGTLQAKWLPPPHLADEQGRCLDRQAVERVAQAVLHQTGIIAKAETKREKETPPLPLELSTLQQESSRRWSMGAQKTLDVAQALYETHKVITYPRTDCRYLPTSQLADVASVLAAISAADPSFAPLVAQADGKRHSRAWDDGKITAHHAIIPTTVSFQVTALSVDEMRLYDLIRRHYLAQFYPAFEYDKTVVDCSVMQELFRATGRVVMVEGWKKVIQEVRKTDKDKEEDEESQILPPINQGEAALVVKATLSDKKTKPPSRYTEGTLIQAMKSVGKLVADARLRQILRETSGIGTEATRAGIIENLLKRQLLKKEGRKNLVSTDPGRMLVDLLPHSVTDPATTAVWEQTLEDIAQGRTTLDEFLAKSVWWVNRLIHNVKARGAAAIHNLPTPPQSATSTEGQCPKCGGHLVSRVAKSGSWAGKSFLGCSRYPQCRYVQNEG